MAVVDPNGFNLLDCATADHPVEEEEEDKAEALGSVLERRFKGTPAGSKSSAPLGGGGGGGVGASATPG